MKQIRFLCVVLSVSVLSLTGCANMKDLSDEQASEIAEYAAGVLLQDSDKYPYRLITKEDEDGESTPTATPLVTPTPSETPAVTEEPSAATQTSADAKEQATDTPKKEVSMNDLLHADGVDVSYTSHRLSDKYGSSEIRAEQGKKMLLVFFSVKNNSGVKKKVNFANRKNITYQVDVDGAQYFSQPCLLENELDYLDTTIAKGKEKTAILVFQVDKSAANASSITLSMEEGDNKASVKIK